MVSLQDDIRTFLSCHHTPPNPLSTHQAWHRATGMVVESVAVEIHGLHVTPIQSMVGVREPPEWHVVQGNNVWAMRLVSFDVGSAMRRLIAGDAVVVPYLFPSLLREHRIYTPPSWRRLRNHARTLLTRTLAWSLAAIAEWGSDPLIQPHTPDPPIMQLECQEEYVFEAGFYALMAHHLAAHGEVVTHLPSLLSNAASHISERHTIGAKTALDQWARGETVWKEWADGEGEEWVKECVDLARRSLNTTKLPATPPDDAINAVDEWVVGLRRALDKA